MCVKTRARKLKRKRERERERNTNRLFLLCSYLFLYLYIFLAFDCYLNVCSCCTIFQYVNLRKEKPTESESVTNGEAAASLKHPPSLNATPLRFALKSIDRFDGSVEPIRIEIVYRERDLASNEAIARGSASQATTDEHVKCSHSVGNKQTLLTSYFKVEKKAVQSASTTNNDKQIRLLGKCGPRNPLGRTRTVKLLRKYSLHRNKARQRQSAIEQKLGTVIRLHRRRATRAWIPFDGHVLTLFTFICIDIYHKYTSAIVAMQGISVNRRTNGIRDHSNSLEINYVNRRLHKIIPNISLPSEDGVPSTYHLSDLQSKRCKSTKLTDNARLMIGSDTKEKDHSELPLIWRSLPFFLIP